MFSWPIKTFEIRGWRPSKYLKMIVWSLEQFINTVKVQKKLLKQNTLVTSSWIQIGKKIFGIQKHTGKVWKHNLNLVRLWNLFYFRFFFTHDNVGDVGFCPSDLEILRKRTLRDIICTCSNVESLPKSVFYIPSDANPKGIHIRFAIFLSLLNFSLVFYWLPLVKADLSLSKKLCKSYQGGRFGLLK